MNNRFALNNKFVARFALAALMALSTGLSFQAQADTTPAPVPTMTFSIPDNLTVHKTQNGVTAASAQPYMLVAVTGHDAAGLRSISFSGGWSGTTAYYPPGYTTATTQLYFYSSYYPVGDYPFKATITGVNGVQKTQTVMVHLVP